MNGPTLHDTVRAFEQQVLAPFIGDVPKRRDLPTSTDDPKHPLEGRRVKFVKQWPDGKRTWLQGELMFVRRELCYVDTPIAGIVEGEAGTLEEV